jgi:cell division protein YceG involved in septum cleavage
MTRVDGDHYQTQTHRDAELATRDARQRRRVWAVVVLLVVVPLAALAVIGGWFWFQLDPPGTSGETVEVRVDDGWSVSRIGEELADRDIIGSSLVFNVYTRLSGKTDFQAGTYDLKRDMGVRDAVSTLEAGPRIDYLELAVPPGLWIPEIAERVGSSRAAVRRRFWKARATAPPAPSTNPPGRRRSRGCCGRTRTASVTPRTRSTSSGRW